MAIWFDCIGKSSENLFHLIGIDRLYYVYILIGWGLYNNYIEDFAHYTLFALIEGSSNMLFIIYPFVLLKILLYFSFVTIGTFKFPFLQYIQPDFNIQQWDQHSQDSQLYVPIFPSQKSGCVDTTFWMWMDIIDQSRQQILRSLWSSNRMLSYWTSGFEARRFE